MWASEQRGVAGSVLVLRRLGTAALALIDAQIGPLVKGAAPDRLNVFGVGIDTAAALLVTETYPPDDRPYARFTLRL